MERSNQLLLINMGAFILVIVIMVLIYQFTDPTHDPESEAFWKVLNVFAALIEIAILFNLYVIIRRNNH